MCLAVTEKCEYRCETRTFLDNWTRNTNSFLMLMHLKAVYNNEKANKFLLNAWTLANFTGAEKYLHSLKKQFACDFLVFNPILCQVCDLTHLS